MAIRAVLADLRKRFPSLQALPDRKLHKLLLSLRRLETYPATDTNRGRPLRHDRNLLDEVRRRLKAILEGETGDRVSIQTFIGRYPPILDWPPDVIDALVRGDPSRLEAAQLARLTSAQLGSSHGRPPKSGRRSRAIISGQKDRRLRCGKKYRRPWESLPSLRPKR